MGLISPGGANLLDFLELRQVLSSYDRDVRTRSGGHYVAGGHFYTIGDVLRVG